MAETVVNLKLTRDEVRMIIAAMRTEAWRVPNGIDRAKVKPLIDKLRTARAYLSDAEF